MSDKPPELTIDLEAVTDPLLSELEALYPGQTHKSAIWHWQFSSRFGRDCRVLTARYGYRLVGFNALMPVSMVYRNRTIDAWWSCDFVVDPEYRGIGIGSRLKETLLERINAPVLSMGISAQALPILLKKGWQPGPQLGLYERIFRPTSLRQLLLKLWGVLRSWSVPLSRTAKKELPQLESVSELPDRTIINELWKRSLSPESASVVKDYDYLYWRYEQFPFQVYHYTLIRHPSGAIQGFMIFRFDSNGRADITDYLGAPPDESLVRVIIRSLQDKGAKAIIWRLQSPLIFGALRRNGFVKKRYASRFVFRQEVWRQPPVTWCLSSGDSDGDFLGAAQDYLAEHSRRDHSEEKYSIRSVSITEMHNSRKDWEQLLSESNANPLFMSWLWQVSWWSVWGELLRLKLRCHFIYLGGRLVGIVPLFRAYRGTFKPVDYQFIGNAWRLSPSVRSEYIEPILARDHEQPLRDFLSQWLGRGSNWSSLVVPDHTGYMADWPNALVRQQDLGYRVNTQGSLSAYLDSLGKNTRLRAFNRQDYLHRKYPSAQWKEAGLNERDVKEFFEHLNKFHGSRWGRPCFSTEAVEFHRQVIRNRSDLVRPLLHYLEIGGCIRSVSYNLWVSGVMYNLQSGFDAGFDRKLSLGTLHFGKLIGLCFEDHQTDALDMLAGKGKRTDYKNHFQGTPVTFYTVQLFPCRVLLLIYSLMDQGKTWLRKRKTGT